MYDRCNFNKSSSSYFEFLLLVSRIHVHVVASFQRDFIGRLPTRKDHGTGTPRTVHGTN
jgi:hypothetical protein